MATPDRQHLHSHTHAFLERHGGSIHLLDIQGNNGGTAHISLAPTTNALQIAEFFGEYGAESQSEDLLTIPRKQNVLIEAQNTTIFSDRGAIINGLRRAMQTELVQLDDEITEARKSLTPERNAVVTYFTDQLRHPSYPGRYQQGKHEDIRQVGAEINTIVAARLSPWQIKQFELALTRELPKWIDEDPSRFTNTDGNGSTVYIGIEYQPSFPLVQALRAASIDPEVFPHMTELILEEGGTHSPKVTKWHRHSDPQIGEVIYPKALSQRTQVDQRHPIRTFFRI